MRMANSTEALCCGCIAHDAEADYNLSLHIGAIFILFAVSIAGTLLPVVSTRGRFASQQSIALECLMAFGFGVVIGTGFIHMMSEGIEMLSNPCLGSIVEKFKSLGLGVVLSTVLLMHFIECESAVFFAGQGGEGGGGHGHHVHGHGHGHGHGQLPMHLSLAPSSVGQSFFAITPVDGDAQRYNHQQQSKPSIDVLAPSPFPHKEENANTTARRKVATVLFEMGVLFHSAVVGVNLGVTGGTGFTTLLIAMCVHQFFEGVALGGSTLGAMDSFKKAMLMNLGFAVTTPLGLVIGILIRSSYSDTSLTALWVQGILNCVAGGILLYTGLVELLTYRMTTNGEFLARSRKQRFTLYVALHHGAALMMMIGMWG